LGQQVVVDNRPGATGTIGSGLASRAPADGYTLVYATGDSHSIFPHLLKTPPYDTRKDFTPIAPIGEFPFVLAVTPNLEAKTLPEFLDLARKSPQPLTHGSWGVGSSGHVASELFVRRTGVKLLHVPYQGTAPLLQALMAGEVSCSICPVPAVEQALQAGRIRAVAAMTRKRLVKYPDLPTLIESGIDQVSATWIGVFGPPGMPADITRQLNRTINECLTEPAVREKLDLLSVLPTMSTVEAYKRFVDEDYDAMGRFIREAGITLS
jgi:tripartite-type tricarboxylate transporter receptor subunit TctC